MKLTTKFTPGPWNIGMRGGHNASQIYAYNGKDQFHDQAICQLYGRIPLNTPLDEVKECEGLANGRLIIASPLAHRLISALAQWIEESGHACLPRPDSLMPDGEETFGQLIKQYLFTTNATKGGEG